MSTRSARCSRGDGTRAVPVGFACSRQWEAAEEPGRRRNRPAKTGSDPELRDRPRACGCGASAATGTRAPGLSRKRHSLHSGSRPGPRLGASTSATCSRDGEDRPCSRPPSQPWPSPRSAPGWTRPSGPSRESSLASSPRSPPRTKPCILMRSPGTPSPVATPPCHIFLVLAPRGRRSEVWLSRTCRHPARRTQPRGKGLRAAPPGPGSRAPSPPSAAGLVETRCAGPAGAGRAAAGGSDAAGAPPPRPAVNRPRLRPRGEAEAPGRAGSAALALWAGGADMGPGRLPLCAQHRRSGRQVAAS